jgi:hypothetical protein
MAAKLKSSAYLPMPLSLIISLYSESQTSSSFLGDRTILAASVSSFAIAFLLPFLAVLLCCNNFQISGGSSKLSLKNN